MAAALRGVTDNWKLKTLAFALGVLLWVVVSAEQVTTNWIWVPLQVEVSDPNYRIARNEIPSEVQVRFTGPGRELLDLALDRPPLRLAIDDVEELVETVPLDPRMVQLPGEVAASALDVRPAAVRLEFTHIETRRLPVEVPLANSLGSDWAIVDSITTTPETVLLTGPADLMARVTALRTQPVELSPGDTILNRTVPLDTAGLGGLDLSTAAVQVLGRLDRVIERSLTNVTVDVGEGVTILPDRVRVILDGPRQAVEAVTPAKFRIVVSIDEIPERIPPGGISVPLRIDGIRPDVQARLDPPAVRLFPGNPEVDTPEGNLPTALSDTVSISSSGGR